MALCLVCPGFPPFPTHVGNPDQAAVGLLPRGVGVAQHAKLYMSSNHSVDGTAGMLVVPNHSLAVVAFKV